MNNHKEITAVSRKQVPNAIVDAKDYDWLSSFKWNVTYKQGTSNFYFHTRIDGKWVKMHRLLLGVYDKNTQVDHINKITYDNRLSNLRICTHRENCLNRKCMNKHGLQGVSKRWNKYHAHIRRSGKTVFLGSYNTAEEANVAFNNAKFS